MNNLLSRQIIATGQHRHCGGLLIIFSISMPQVLHLAMTFISQLNTGKGMNTVINTGMQGNKTAQHFRIGRIHNGINCKSRNAMFITKLNKYR